MRAEHIWISIILCKTKLILPNLLIRVSKFLNYWLNRINILWLRCLNMKLQKHDNDRVRIWKKTDNDHSNFGKIYFSRWPSQSTQKYFTHGFKNKFQNFESKNNFGTPKSTTQFDTQKSQNFQKSGPFLAKFRKSTIIHQIRMLRNSNMA